MNSWPLLSYVVRRQKNSRVICKVNKGLVGLVAYASTLSLFAQNGPSFSIDSYLDSAKHACLRFKPKDSAGVIGLPFSYYSPSPGSDAMFSELYYWDCFFTNRYGLLASGSDQDIQMATNHVNNLIYLIQRFGYVPNANRFSMLNRSQPPLLSLMVRDIYMKTGDVNWLAAALIALEQEYRFWMQQRSDSVKIGSRTVVLNHYGHHAQSTYLKHFFRIISQRLQSSVDTAAVLVDLALTPGAVASSDTIAMAAHWLAEAESGWDFTPRFQGRCEDYFPVDLNAILANYEQNLAWFYGQLRLFAEEKSEKNHYTKSINFYQRALKDRIWAMNHCMWSTTAEVYLDYDKNNRVQSAVLSAASFFPIWLFPDGKEYGWLGWRSAGKLSKTASSTLILLIQDDCVMPLLKSGPMRYPTQWNFGNVWAPFQAIAIETITTSFPAEYQFWKMVIANAFRTKVEQEFQRSGQLKEKYSIFKELVSEEYSTPPMMGWTWSVYRWIKLSQY